MSGSIHQNTRAAVISGTIIPFSGIARKRRPTFRAGAWVWPTQLHPTLKEQARDDFQQSGQPEEHRVTEHPGNGLPALGKNHHVLPGQKIESLCPFQTEDTHFFDNLLFGHLM